MGWTPHKISVDGSEIYIRGGDNGFNGAYIMSASGDTISIDHPEVLEMIVSEKIKNKIKEKIEKVLDET